MDEAHQLVMHPNIVKVVNHTGHLQAKLRRSRLFLISLAFLNAGFVVSNSIWAWATDSYWLLGALALNAYGCFSSVKASRRVSHEINRCRSIRHHFMQLDSADSTEKIYHHVEQLEALFSHE